MEIRTSPACDYRPFAPEGSSVRGNLLPRRVRAQPAHKAKTKQNSSNQNKNFQNKTNFFKSEHYKSKSEHYKFKTKHFYFKKQNKTKQNKTKFFQISKTICRTLIDRSIYITTKGLGSAVPTACTPYRAERGRDGDAVDSKTKCNVMEPK